MLLGATYAGADHGRRQKGKTMTQDVQIGSVFSVEDKTDTIIAEIQAAGITQRYECTMASCDNPVCTCGTVYMGFTPYGIEDRDRPVPTYQVDIDVIHRKLAFKDEKNVSNENLTFAQLLFSRMDEADFEFLWKSHIAYKNEITEKADIKQIETEFDFHEVEENGLMYMYNDVLPYGDPLYVRFKDRSCAIFDQYCLLPKCSCTDATLTLVAEGDDSAKEGKELCTVAVNYRNKQWAEVRESALSVDIEAVRSAVEDEIPDLYTRLPKRHLKLKAIYANCKKRHFKQQVKSPKIGRNDPCPCGSGKKYKKCCMLI